VSLEDRDYFRAPRREGFGWGRTPAAWSVIGLLLAAWLFASGARSRAGDASVSLELEEALVLRPVDVARLRLPRLVTYAFVPGPGDAVAGLFALVLVFAFGRGLERRHGSWAFLRTFIGAGITAGLAATALGFALHRETAAFSGAAGCAFGVTASAAVRDPADEVLGGVALRVLAPLCILAVAGWTAGWFVEASGLLSLAHLAGAGYGVADATLARRRRGRPARSVEAPVGASPDPTPSVDVPTEASPRALDPDSQDVARRVDALLARIAESGIDSLDRDEQEWLKRASRRFRGAGGSR
jgi:membrane associated rhomboid family serine protease